jgi:hypothetical protein
MKTTQLARLLQAAIHGGIIPATMTVGDLAEALASEISAREPICLLFCAECGTLGEEASPDAEGPPLAFQCTDAACPSYAHAWAVALPGRDAG